MRKLMKVVVASAAAVVATTPNLASAGGLLGGLPRVAIGNNAPLVGSDSSHIGIGILTPQPNGTPYSLRVLGEEKLLGLYLEDPFSDELYNLQLNTPLDGEILP